MQLLLVRHGQTSSNVAGALDTAAPGAPLTELGRRQALERAASLHDLEIGALFCSTLLRARETAAPIAADHGIEAVVRAGIREVTAGTLEMNTDLDSRRQYHDIAFGWALGRPDVPMPGTDFDGHRFLAEYTSVVDEAVAAAAGRTAVLVTHGAAMRLWYAMTSVDVDAADVRDHPLPNTGTLALDRDADGLWRLLARSDAASSDDLARIGPDDH